MYKHPKSWLSTHEKHDTVQNDQTVPATSHQPQPSEFKVLLSGRKLNLNG